METVRVALKPEIQHDKVMVVSPVTNRKAQAPESMDNHPVQMEIAESTDLIRVPKTAVQTMTIEFSTRIETEQYAFVCLKANRDVSVATGQMRVTGIMALAFQSNDRVSKNMVQKPEGDIGVDTLEFWIPQRYPEGRNLAIRFDEPLAGFGLDNLINGIIRPVGRPNAWVADSADRQPTLTLSWIEPQAIRRIELDHPGSGWPAALFEVRCYA